MRKSIETRVVSVSLGTQKCMLWPRKRPESEAVFDQDAGVGVAAHAFRESRDVGMHSMCSMQTSSIHSTLRFSPLIAIEAAHLTIAEIERMEISSAWL